MSQHGRRNDKRSSSPNGVHKQRHNKNGKHSKNGSKTMTCNWCTKPGHKEADCRRKQNGQPKIESSSSKGGDKHCDFHPNSKNHSTEDCSRNSNGGKSNKKNHTDRDGDIQMEGFAFANPADSTQFFNSTQYCPGCNATDHHMGICPNLLRSAARLETSHEYLRAKLEKDVQECQEKGLPIQQDAYNERLAEVLDAEQNIMPGNIHAAPASVFSTQPYVKLSGSTFTANKPTTTWQQPQQTSTSTSSLSNYISDFRWLKHKGPITQRDRDIARRFVHLEQKLMEEERTVYEKQVRAKIDNAKQMYTKHNCNRFIQQRHGDLIIYGKVPPRRVEEVHFALAQGYQFFRDPDAIAAIAERKIPICNGCSRHGRILDRRFEDVKPGADVFEVEDFNDWGVTVCFPDCKCCNSTPERPGPGYRFEPVPDVDFFGDV